MAELRIELRLRRVGNSLGVILPKQALEALGVEAEAGRTLTLVRSRDGGGLELRYEDAEFERRLAVLRETIRRNRNTLSALAQ